MKISCLHQCHVIQGPLAPGTDLQTQEDGHSHGTLQRGQQSLQVNGLPPELIHPCTAIIQAPSNGSTSWEGAISWHGPQCPCEGWWSHTPDFCNLPVHLQSPGDLTVRNMQIGFQKKRSKTSSTKMRTLNTANSCKFKSLETLVPTITTRNSTNHDDQG